MLINILFLSINTELIFKMLFHFLNLLAPWEIILIYELLFLFLFDENF